MQDDSNGSKRIPRSLREGAQLGGESSRGIGQGRMGKLVDSFAAATFVEHELLRDPLAGISFQDESRNAVTAAGICLILRD